MRGKEHPSDGGFPTSDSKNVGFFSSSHTPPQISEKRIGARLLPRFCSSLERRPRYREGDELETGARSRRRRDVPVRWKWLCVCVYVTHLTPPPTSFHSKETKSESQTYDKIQVTF